MRLCRSAMSHTVRLELGIVCYPRRHYLSASIPIERKSIHIKKWVEQLVPPNYICLTPLTLYRLLSQGYRVGIVDQQETAALKKAGSNRNSLFKRGLTELYTAATCVTQPR